MQYTTDQYATNKMKFWKSENSLTTKNKTDKKTQCKQMKITDSVSLRDYEKYNQEINFVYNARAYFVLYMIKKSVKVDESIMLSQS